MKLIRSLLCLFFIVIGALAHAAEFKVLVVMSYEEDNPWVREIREGIEGVLHPSSEISYFYMNTKTNRTGGPDKAAQAHALFQSLQPHGVITADDDAQSMFVVPYLKDKTQTPIMFNGVNATAQKYGFPNSHISGTLERAHVRESLAFIKQIISPLQNACFLTADVPAGHALHDQVVSEKASYPATVAAFHIVKNNQQIESLGKTLNAACDVLFVDSLEGISDRDSKPQTNGEVLHVLRRIYGKPIVAGNRYQVEQGAWAEVVKTGQEQGELSADMLLQAMRGKPVNNLPVTRNTRGQRIINVTALEEHAVVPKPTVLRGALLVKQQP